MAYKNSSESLSNFLKKDIYLCLIVLITFKLTAKILDYIKILFKEWLKHMVGR